MFALADCNNFYASCERVFRPDLQGKPIIVLSSNDGCAVARSNEAKALGIKMGAPLFKIRDIVEKHNVAVFSGNMALYGDMSQRVRWVLEEYAPSVEVYSIDECFLDLRGMNNIDFSKLISLNETAAYMWKSAVEKDFDEELGFIFESAIFDKIKPCANNCIFCFVDQQPEGLRDSLYIKDDDYRLSYLQGTYITTTNLTEKADGLHLHFELYEEDKLVDPTPYFSTGK